MGVGGVQLRAFQLAPECTPLHPSSPWERPGVAVGRGGNTLSTGRTKRSPGPGTVCVSSAGEADHTARVAATHLVGPQDAPGLGREPSLSTCCAGIGVWRQQRHHGSCPYGAQGHLSDKNTEADEGAVPQPKSQPSEQSSVRAEGAPRLRVP